MPRRYQSRKSMRFNLRKISPLPFARLQLQTLLRQSDPQTHQHLHLRTRTIRKIPQPSRPLLHRLPTLPIRGQLLNLLHLRHLHEGQRTTVLDLAQIKRQIQPSLPRRPRRTIPDPYRIPIPRRPNARNRFQYRFRQIGGIPMLPKYFVHRHRHPLLLRTQCSP